MYASHDAGGDSEGAAFRRHHRVEFGLFLARLIFVTKNNKDNILVISMEIRREATCERGCLHHVAGRLLTRESTLQKEAINSLSERQQSEIPSLPRQYSKNAHQCHMAFVRWSVQPCPSVLPRFQALNKQVLPSRGE